MLSDTKVGGSCKAIFCLFTSLEAKYREESYDYLISLSDFNLVLDSLAG